MIFDRVISLEIQTKLLFGCMYKVEIACVDTSKVKFKFGPMNFDRIIPLEHEKN
jgi:hypothetical protein